MLKFSRRNLFILAIIVLARPDCYESIAGLADIFKDFAISSWGLSLFILLTAICMCGQYFILRMIKAKNRDQQIKRVHLSVVERAVTLVQATLTAIMVFLILQLIFVFNTIHSY